VTDNRRHGNYLRDNTGHLFDEVLDEGQLAGYDIRDPTL